MIQIGKTNKLIIIRETPVGLFLGEDDKEVVLLPTKYIPKKFEVGQEMEVFVYKDSEDRPIATTRKPYAELNTFACLKVVQTNKMGAFLDWGLEKDLFVPFKEQKYTMHEGYSYVVYIYLDQASQRIVASNKIGKFLSNDVLTLAQGDEVQLMVFDESELGLSCIVNSQHRGLIYHNDVYKEILIGDELTGYVKMIREGNLIDLSLQKIGFKNVLSSTDKILEYLQTHEGFMPFTDKSTPDEIADAFEMSKATFKKSIGVLYRQRKVVIADDGVRLIAPPPDAGAAESDD